MTAEAASQWGHPHERARRLWRGPAPAASLPGALSMRPGASVPSGAGPEPCLTRQPGPSPRSSTLTCEVCIAHHCRRFLKLLHELIQPPRSPAGSRGGRLRHQRWSLSECKAAFDISSKRTARRLWQGHSGWLGPRESRVVGTLRSAAPLHAGQASRAVGLALRGTGCGNKTRGGAIRDREKAGGLCLFLFVLGVFSGLSWFLVLTE